MATSKSTTHSPRIAIYARVSTTDQSTGSQLLDLRKYVSDRGWQIYREFVDEGISGTKDSRPALDQLMDDAKKRRFDIVLVWRFDRFARSTRHLINALEEFKNLGIDFVSFQENIDTSSPLGSAIFTIISAVAQLERDIIAERVKAGLRRAKENGKKLGRPRVAVDATRVALLRNQGRSWAEISKQLGIGKGTAQRAFYSLPKNPGGKPPVNG
jgi:DNA invertase Pin-like site-specific DNA recombinase